MSDYFLLLEISPDATKDEIKAAFMKQALRWHPDKAETEEQREVHTKRYEDLQQAYKILSNDETRQMYKDSQQNTFLDFKKEGRDLGYGETKEYRVKNEETGQTTFDLESFNKAFAQSEHGTVAQTLMEQTCPINQSDINSFLTERQNTDLAFAREHDVLNEQGDFNPAMFNAMFNHLKETNGLGTGLTEYTGDVQGTIGGLMEADANLTGVLNMGSMNLNAHNDLSFEGFTVPSQAVDMSQISVNERTEATLTQAEIDSRVAKVMQDRNALLQLKPEDFVRQATEIEQMYGGLFSEMNVVEPEGLEAPTTN